MISSRPVNVQSFTESLRRLPGADFVARVVQKSGDDYAKDMAAGTAYFSFFSLFPLILGFIAIASHFLDAADVQARVDALLAETLPGSADFVRNNLDALVRLQGAAGIVSIIALIWSASKMFAAMNRGINRALGLKRTHPFFLSPLRYVLLTTVVSGLVFVLLAGSTGLAFLRELDPGVLGGGLHDLLTFAGGHVISYSFVFLIMGALYLLVPYEKPSWREVVPAAAAAAFLFELGKAGFVFYINNLAHLEAVYGSVSSIIALLLWLYFSARVLLLGAELIAVRRERVAEAES